MSRIFTSGAEEAEPNALWDYFEIEHGSDYLAVFSPRSFYSTVTAPPSSGVAFAPRTGRGMYLLSNQSFGRQDFGTDTSHTELYWGFAVRFSALANNPFLIACTDDPSVYSNYLGLRVNASTGAIEVSRTGTTIVSSSAGAVSINTWHYFEVWFKPLNSNGRAVVYVDGIKIIDYTGDTTNEKEYFNAWQISGIETTTLRPLTAFDDIVCNTPDGAVNNTYPGQVRLMPIRPQAAGTHADWSRAGVDLGFDAAQARNGMFDFTALQTSDADDLVTFRPEIPDLPAGATITNVIVQAHAKVESGAGVLAPMVISNATPYISADQTLLSTRHYYTYIWATNPDDSAAWEEADLALLEIGVSS